MQQTKKYKFNLIDTSDTFSPEALNANAQAAEDKLAALEKTAADHKTELEAAAGALAALNADVRPGAPGEVARIAYGTYTGKGTGGASGACRLDFDFKPLLVFVCSTMYYYTHFMGRPGTYSNSGYGPATVVWGERSVARHYGNSSLIREICNEKGMTYYYIAIGVPV